MPLAPRAVIVYRHTEFTELLARHGTRGQAAFFLSARGRDLDSVESHHAATESALAQVAAGIPPDWRRGRVERTDLDRFVFAPEDVVIAVGPDGLVANVAKYLTGQPVLGVNPEPERNPGVLVRHSPNAVAGLLAGGLSARSLTMVSASTDDGQRLSALNEIYLGHPSHQSARYRIEVPTGAAERQSSSGILIGTGTGSTGWCRSIWQQRRSELPLPDRGQPLLCWFVREAWPSPATGTELVEGLLGDGEKLTITAESDLVVFGDGMESDALHIGWGQRVTVSRAERTLRLVS